QLPRRLRCRKLRSHSVEGEERTVQVTDERRMTTATGTAPPTFSPGRGWPRWGLAAFLLVAAVTFFALGLHRHLSWDYLRTHLDLLQSQARQHLLLALAVFFVVYVAVTALSLPAAAALTLVAGALFGRWLGTGVVSLASTVGATLAFLSSRYVFR